MTPRSMDGLQKRARNEAKYIERSMTEKGQDPSFIENEMEREQSEFRGDQLDLRKERWQRRDRQEAIKQEAD